MTKNTRGFTAARLILLLFFLPGCVQIRDYTGTRDGSFVVGVNNGFDQGVDKKSYRIINENTAVIIGDTQNDIIFKIGLPTARTAELDGCQRWAYKDKRIDLFFSGNRLKGWSCSRYEEAEAQNAD